MMDEEHIQAAGRAGEGESTPLAERPIDEVCINTIRTLAMDAVQQANSGHPGTPMGLAPVAYTLWQSFLRYDPEDPSWPDRDRFVLSNGHASMLLYALLYLAGVRGDGSGAAVTLDEIKRFRELGSACPGHPEYRHTAGVETTTGPLGQGCATSVGMAIARRWLGGHFNKPDAVMFDYDIYTLCGDGDMMEGVTSEAASLAGHLKLGNLCWIYDSNRITIEGSTELAFSDDVAMRFRAYGWNVHRVGDANDTQRVAQAIRAFRRRNDTPTLIVVASHIGYGAPHKQDTAAAHGEPLGADEVRLAKRAYGWPEEAKFLVPAGVREHFARGVGRRGRRLHADWTARMEAYRRDHPELAAQLAHLLAGELPEGWESALPTFPADAKGVASRDASGKVENAIAQHYPWLIGGAADLAPSTKTLLTFDGAGTFGLDTPAGRNLHFGIREHAMGAAANGIALSGVRPYGAGFLIFSDYMKPTIRLSALMELPVVYIFTHDFDRPRPGRADPPAGRAADRAAQHPRPHHPAPGRRQRGGGGVAGRDGPETGARLPGAQPPAAADVRSHALRPGRGARARRLCAGRCAGRGAGGDPDRHRQRGRSVRRGAGGARTGRHRRARGQHAVVGIVRASGPGLSR